MVGVLVYVLAPPGATLLHREAEHPSPAKGEEARRGGGISHPSLVVRVMSRSASASAPR